MFSRKSMLIASFVVVALGLLGWGWSTRGIDRDQASLAIFSVANMTCGSCAGKIKTALGEVDGVGQVEVSVTAGRAEVEYVASEADPATIATAMTAAGYPASLRENLSAGEYRDLRAETGRLAGRYVAKIGERLLSRDEFQQVVEQRKLALPQPVTAEALNGLRLQVWNDLLQRELLLNSAEGSQVVVPDGEVAVELERLQAGHADFATLIAQRFGSLEAFRRQLKNDLIIRKHLNDNVTAAATSDSERQRQLDGWYRQLVEATPVIIFDPALKAAAAGSGSGCGGSCCG